MQITINIGYMEKSCESLENFICKITNGDGESVASSGHLVTLKDQVFRFGILVVK